MYSCETGVESGPEPHDFRGSPVLAPPSGGPPVLRLDFLGDLTAVDLPAGRPLDVLVPDNRCHRWEAG